MMSDVIVKVKMSQEAVGQLLLKNRKLENALKKIAKWFGEFPDTGKFWGNDKNRPVSYASAFGSNGERDYMRGVASQALYDE